MNDYSEHKDNTVTARMGIICGTIVVLFLGWLTLRGCEIVNGPESQRVQLEWLQHREAKEAKP